MMMMMKVLVSHQAPTPDASSISKSTTEDCSGSSFTIETITASEEEYSTTPSVYQKKNLNRTSTKSYMTPRITNQI